MSNIRLIPVLLSDGPESLVKTTKFKNPIYLGDPVNAVKIFNEKEVDELIFLDINASKLGRKPSLDYIREFAGECFMPVAYGGGLSTIQEVKEVLNAGVEKVVLNNAALNNLKIVSETADKYGSSATVVAIDVVKDFWGNYKVYQHTSGKHRNLNPVDYALAAEKAGAGEIFLNNVDREGTMNGFDNKLIKLLIDAVGIPVIASGGAGKLEDIREAAQTGVRAFGCGSLFAFKGVHRAVLISYPSQEEIKTILKI